MRIELKNIRKRFAKTEVLRGIDLDIEAGRRVSLIGPNGSGKSTFLRAMLGLLECEGEVLLDGKSPYDHRVDLARKIAYVPQIAPQLSASVSEIVKLVSLTREIPASDIAKVAIRLDLDVEGIATRPFRNLSGGMKQKLLIAIAFASKPKLLVLDEPTASLDATARERFFALFDTVAQDVTLLLCSHRIEELRHLANHVVALDEGKIAYEGPATTYLVSRGTSVLEAHVESTEGGEWLEERGFRRGMQGWWVRSLPQTEKVSVVKELAQHLNGSLKNLLIRDLEKVDVSHEGGVDADQVS